MTLACHCELISGCINNLLHYREEKAQLLSMFFGKFWLRKPEQITENDEIVGWSHILSALSLINISALLISFEMNCFRTRLFEYQPSPHYRSSAATDFFGNPFRTWKFNNVRKLLNVLFAGKNQLWGWPLNTPTTQKPWQFDGEICRLRHQTHGATFERRTDMISRRSSLISKIWWTIMKSRSFLKAYSFWKGENKDKICAVRL